MARGTCVPLSILQRIVQVVKTINAVQRRGADKHAFLVEAITGIETVKAMAVEPAMQRHWDEQLAREVGPVSGPTLSATSRVRGGASSV